MDEHGQDMEKVRAKLANKSEITMASLYMSYEQGKNPLSFHYNHYTNSAGWLRAGFPVVDFDNPQCMNDRHSPPN